MKTVSLLHQEALLAAKNFKAAEARLVDALIAVECERVFLKLGYSSLFNYSVQALGLSESVAYNAIAVARKSREVPALQAEIRSGSIGISKAKKIVSVLTPENKKIWIEKAKTLSSRALEKEVARENPKQAVAEKATYVSGKRMNLTLGVEETLMLKLRRAQDRVSQARGKAVSLEETLEELTGFYLRHKDPVEKAKRVIAKKGVPASVTPEKVKSETHPKLVTGPVRIPIPAATLHQIRVRDENRCQAKTPGGGSCGERRWVDLHHIQPVNQGGTNQAQNLITLCRAHHLQEHRGELSPEMSLFRG